MAVDNRSTSALFKRAEQIRRWQESETNKQEVFDNHRTRKVNFTDGCIFLAACAAGDKQEVIRLLQKGADIDTANVDGLTALHAACIDDNLDMVEFLVDQGTDVNRGDMEGWTPLHATASCGFNSIAKFLIDRGADLSLVNNDGDLAIDIADSDEMEGLLQEEIESRGIDCEASRNREQRRMLEDAQEWIVSGYLMDRPHPKTGATSLHVAAAKGYIKVMSLLLEAGCDINAKDHDGWTPLHAAAHWVQREAVEVLCENGANMDVRNFVGQSAFDVADSSLIKLMEELKKKQDSMKLVNMNKQTPRKRKTSPHREHSNKKEREDPRECDGTSGEDESSDVEKRNKVNKANAAPQIIPTSALSNKNSSRTQSSEARSENAFDESEVQSWRRPSSFRKSNQEERNQKDEVARTISTAPSRVTASREGEEERKRTPPAAVEESLSPAALLPSSSSSSPPPVTTITSAGLASLSTNHTTNSKDPRLLARSASLRERIQRNHMDSMEPLVSSSAVLTTNTSSTTRSIGRSFVPPSRDEESETQRKAHAKMVRSTRRSTQGVTLEDIKSAEQLMKNKQQQQQQQQQQATSSSPESKEQSSSTPAATTPASPTKPKPDSPTKTDEEERRPSWRLKVDDVDKNRFSLENVRSKDKSEPENDADTPTVTVQLRRKPTEDKGDEEKEGERNSQTREGTQAAIQRRKKPKRRSTGRVQVNMDVSVAEDGSTVARCRLAEKSVSDKGDAAKGSTTSLGSAVNSRPSSRSSSIGPENGDVDYKRLYEEQLEENFRVHERLRSTENELRQSRENIDLNTKRFNTRLAMAESDKREKRALERKLSEMEEELKLMEQLKQENQRLKDENGALIRVISKLSK